MEFAPVVGTLREGENHIVTPAHLPFSESELFVIC